MGSDEAPRTAPPIDGLTIEQIDDEQARLHEEVTRLLERISALRALKDAITADQGRHLTGKALTDAALTDPASVERLRAITRATHPRLLDIQRYSADVSGLTPAWAPVLLLHRDIEPDESEEIAASLREWFALHEPNNLIEQHQAKEARHFNHVLVDLRGSGVGSRQRAQLWIRRDADEAFLIDSGSQLQRHQTEGTLAEVLAYASSAYYCD